MSIQNNVKNPVNLAIRQKFVAKAEATAIKQAQANATAKGQNGTLLYPTDKSTKDVQTSALNGALLFPNKGEKPLQPSMDEILETSVQNRQSDLQMGPGFAAKMGKALLKAAKTSWTFVASSLSALIGTISTLVKKPFAATAAYLSKLTGKDAKLNAALSAELPGAEALNYQAEHEKLAETAKNFDEVAGKGVVNLVKGDIEQAAKDKAAAKLAATVSSLNAVANPALIEELKSVMAQGRQKSPSTSKASSATVSTETVNEIKADDFSQFVAATVEVLG